MPADAGALRSTPSQNLKPHRDLECHQPPAPFEEVVVGASVALRDEVGEVDLRCPIADRDGDLALSDDDVGDLVGAPEGETLLLQVVGREDVMNVAAIQQEVKDRDVAREEVLVAELGLGRLVAEAGLRGPAACRGRTPRCRPARACRSEELPDSVRGMRSAIPTILPSAGA